MKVSNEQKINRSKNNFPTLNNNKDYFKSFNQEVLNEINYAREKPEEYILKLEDIKNNLSSKNEKYLYIDNIPYIYKNLFASLENAISYLKTQKKLPKLICLPQISSVCQDLKAELVSKDNIIEKDENNKFKECMNKYGNSFGENYEIIGYNLLDPEFIVLNLILGDGDYSKLGRKIIFNPNLKYIGIDAYFLDENHNFHILVFSEDFIEKTKSIEALKNKYKNKNPTYISKVIFYECRTNYIEKEDDNKINNIINSAKKSRKKYKSGNKYKSSKLRHKNKRKINFDEYNNKIKNDIYYNYYTHNLNDNFDENELFETEFENKWGKVEKDKNFQKKIFTTSSTTENGLNTTIITEIYENVQNGRKKGYFTEEKTLKNYNKSLKNENAEKEKRDMIILKDLEKLEKERMNTLYKDRYKTYNNKNNTSIDFCENGELPEGVEEIRTKRKNIIDSNGKPAVEVIKTVKYEDGSMQNLVNYE